MDKVIIPFSPLPAKALMSISARFKGFGARFAKPFPYLKIELKQAGIPFSAEEYGAVMFVVTTFYFVSFFLIGLIFALRLSPGQAFIMAPTVALLFSFLILVQLSLFPKIVLKRKVRNIERNLIFGLRTLLVEIRSGVSLFDALNMVANGNYGMVSTEFKKATELINTGTLEDEALEEIASDNPSMFFRRAVWQLVNGMKAGADISDVLSSLVDSLMKEQRIEIRRYGGKLRVLSLVYMMLGVIIPALGITFLIILASFPQVGVGELLFWGLLGGIIVAQFMYLGVIKSSRPNLMAD
jgi:flagellar protein FlaJ